MPDLTSHRLIYAKACLLLLGGLLALLLLILENPHAPFARFVATETRAGRELTLDDLIVLRGVADRGYLDRWSAGERLQLPDDDAAARLASLRERGYLLAHGRGRGTAYRLARNLSDLLRGPGATERDMMLDDEAIRLRVQAVLSERSTLTNADVRRVSGYSRTEALRMMRALARDGIVKLVGRGRGAHYVAGAALSPGRRAGRGRAK